MAWELDTKKADEARKRGEVAPAPKFPSDKIYVYKEHEFAHMAKEMAEFSDQIRDFNMLLYLRHRTDEKAVQAVAKLHQKLLALPHIQVSVSRMLKGRQTGANMTVQKPATRSKAPAKAKAVVKEAKAVKTSKVAKAPAVLSGGNPQIPKADGDAPVQAYIAAVPGWKREVGERLDAIITRSLPKVAKAVKWNSPLYGVEGRGWFLGVHVFTHYVKVTFFQGASLKPLPPGESKGPDARHLDIREGDEIDEAQFGKWVKQAAKLPGFLGPK